VRKSGEKKHFIYIVFTYRKGKVHLFLFFAIFLLAFVEAGAAKNLMLNCLPGIFAVPESSINAIDVAHISS